MHTPIQLAERLNAAGIIDFIADLFHRRGALAYIGEPVTVADHMLQCAALAHRSGAPDSWVAAALLHDIGHFANDFPENAAERGIDNCHEEAGASLLEPFFPHAVTRPIALHVRAKRYLVATEPGYAEGLSQASAQSLALQGGPMTGMEIARFTADPFCEAACAIRRWDERSKSPGVDVPAFEAYRPLLEGMLRKR